MAGPFAAFGDLEFQYWIPQLLRQPKNLPTVVRTLSHRDSTGTNAWFNARDDRGELDGYLADVRGAWDLADTLTPSPQPIGTQCLCALIQAVVEDLAAQILPALSERFVRGGVWTRDQAVAYARANNDAEAALEAISDALSGVTGDSADDSPGPNRETLVALALAVGTRRMTERKMTLFTRIASKGAPHEIAAMLDGIAAEDNEGTRLGGLSEIVPHLPEDLLTLATSIARDFTMPTLRAEALAIVATRLAGDAQRDCIDAALSIARSALASHSWDGSDLLSRLASTVPPSHLGAVLDLARQADVVGGALQSILAAVFRRMAEDDPERVSADAEDLTGHHRDSVLAAAAVSTARREDWRRAIEITSQISGWGEDRAEALRAILPVLPAVDDPGFLRELARLRKWQLVPFLQKVIGPEPLTEQDARALWGVAQSWPDKFERFRACAVIAPLLGTDHVSELLEDILHDARHASGWAIADLARGLNLVQVRQAFDWLATRFTNGRDDVVAALGMRLVDLGYAEKAITRLSDARFHFERSRALAKLAPQVPDRLLPAIRAACQPRPITEDRIAARQALVPHLPPDRAQAVIGEIVADAAAIPSWPEHLGALAALVGDGVLPAQVPLNEAIRDACATPYGVTRDGNVVDALTVAGPMAVWVPDLIPALSSLAPPYRLSALLTLALAAEAATAARAAQAAVALALAHPAAIEDTGWDWEAPVTSAAVAAAVLALGDDKAFSRAAAIFVTFLGSEELARAVRRAQEIPSARTRLPLLATLSLAMEPGQPSGQAESSRAEIAAREYPNQQEWLGDDDLLTAGLFVLAPAEALRGDILKRVSGAARTATNPEAVLDLVLNICWVLDGEVPADLIGLGLGAILDLNHSTAWWKATYLAELASEADLTRLLKALSDDEIRTCHSDVAAFAAAALARRASELGSIFIVLDSLRCLNSVATQMAGAAAALTTLPDELLGSAEVVASDDQAYGALAVSAAERGDADLSRSALGSISSLQVRRKALELLAERIAPEIASEFADQMSDLPPRLRAMALASLADKIDAPERDQIVLQAVTVTFEPGGRGAPDRRRIMAIVGPQLAQPAAIAIARQWLDAVRASAEKGRSAILADVAAFTQPLISCFGPAVACTLDDAIRAAGQDFWP